MRSPFKLGICLALFVVSVCGARDLTKTNGKLLPFSPEFPRQLRPDVTFMAPLIDSLVANGCGDTTPTYSGGGMTGAGSMRSYDGCDGLIHWASGGPVFDCGRGYQSMGARTNLLKDNVGFVDGWGPAGLSTTGYTVSITGPDGSTSTNYVMVENAANSAHATVYPFAGTTEKNTAISIYAKAGGRTFITLLVSDRLTGSVRRTFNLTTGAVGAGGVAGSASHWWESSSSISPAPLGWYRCVMVTGTPSGTTKNAIVYMSNTDGSISYAGTNSSSLFTFGAQVEDNATFAGPVIKTAGTTGARAKDNASWPIALNLSSGSTWITRNGIRETLTNSTSLSIDGGFGNYRNIVSLTVSLTGYEAGQIRP